MSYSSWSLKAKEKLFHAQGWRGESPPLGVNTASSVLLSHAPTFSPSLKSERQETTTCSKPVYVCRKDTYLSGKLR